MSNAYAALRALFPDPSLEVGTVVSISSGTATIELPGGGRAQARGDTTVGARVFFRAGAIEGAAPSLPIVEVEV